MRPSSGARVGSAVHRGIQYRKVIEPHVLIGQRLLKRGKVVRQKRVGFMVDDSNGGPYASGVENGVELHGPEAIRLQSNAHFCFPLGLEQ